VIASLLAETEPKLGDAVFIPAGKVHTLGDDVVVFEIQPNSDATFRSYDWGHLDGKAGRPIQVEQ
jgi:mannose-6-phosphate isomerase